jgi:NAD(P)-dependent dehydrogenase (short-subunit alcohol dehydrogenase family)
VLGRREAVAREVAAAIAAAGGEATALRADVLDWGDLERARDAVLDRWGAVDVLVNAAGGNLPAATVAEGASVFDVPEAAWRDVVDLNLLGTVLPTAVFGAAMADRDPAAGVVVNVSSMAASRPLSRVVGYSAAKAAVENLTRWLAVDLAVKHGPGMRVNAVAPGFFLGEQNRALLVGEDGEPTPRGRRILDHTPLGRFGEPGDLVGAVVWLCSPARPGPRPCRSCSGCCARAWPGGLPGSPCWSPSAPTARCRRTPSTACSAPAQRSGRRCSPVSGCSTTSGGSRRPSPTSAAWTPPRSRRSAAGCWLRPSTSGSTGWCSSTRSCWSAGRCSRTRSSGSPAATSTSSPASAGPRSSGSPTGWAPC